METKETLLHLSERLEKLINRLPAALQKPILQELVPLKDLFLRQRAPRIILAGDPSAGSAGLFNAIFTAPVAPFAEVAAADSVPAAAGWQDFSHQGQGVLRLLDTRSADAAAPLADATRSALAAEPPDLFLFLRNFSGADDVREATELDRLESLLGLAAQMHTIRPCVVGVVVYSAEAEAPAAEMDAARGRLQAALAARPQIARRLAPALDVATFMRFRLDGSFDPESDRRRHIPELVHVLVTELPNEARLEMARLSGARDAQAKIAQTLIKSVSAVSGALGAQPIPLADLPFLLTFQIAMVAGIIYISGRELSLKLATEFMGTLGFNVGLGLALREGARAAARAATKLLLPGIGNAVSGLVAAGGTYAIGRAASAYYIEGMSLPNVRLLFKKEGRLDRSVFNLLHRRQAKELPKPDAA
jgi:uncharacterized protein (DUF697 family)